MSDANKKISLIDYNYLNLPAVTAVTTYIGGGVYENDTLQFTGAEDDERIRL